MNRYAPGAVDEAAWLPSLVLILALVQGSSLSLSLAFHFTFVSGLLPPGVNVLWMLLYLLALIGLMARYGINWVSWMCRFRLLLTVLLAGVMISSAWSVDPGLTLVRGVHLMGTSLVGLYIGLSVPMERLLHVTAVFMGVLLCASAASALFYPALGLENYQGTQVWRGVTASKNTLGFWAAASVLLFGSLWLNGPMAAKSSRHAFARGSAGASSSLASMTGRRLPAGLLPALGILLALAVLARSGSATSWLAMVSGALLMGYLDIARRWQLGLVGTVALGLMASGLAALAFLQINTAELIGRSSDLTGRGEVWQQTWALIMREPLTGYGYGTLWFPTDSSLWIQESLTRFNWTVYHAHNGLLQVASEIGLPLTLLTILMIVVLMIEVIQSQYRNGSVLSLFVPGFLLTLLVSNYAEARLLVNRELYWIFFLALPVALLSIRSSLPAGNIADDTAGDTVRHTAGDMLDAMMPAMPDAARRKSLRIAHQRRDRRALKARLRHRRGAESVPVAGLLSS